MEAMTAAYPVYPLQLQTEDFFSFIYFYPLILFIFTRWYIKAENNNPTGL